SALATEARFAEALVQYRACVCRDPRHKVALLGVAYCLRSLGQSQEALAALDELLEHEAEHAGGSLLRGQTLLDLDRGEEALAWLRRAEKSAPPDGQVVRTL